MTEPTFTDDQSTLLRETILWAEKESHRPIGLREWFQQDYVRSPEEVQRDLDEFLTNTETRLNRGFPVRPELLEDYRALKAMQGYECKAAFCVAGKIAFESDVLTRQTIDDGNDMTEFYALDENGNPSYRMDVEDFATDRLGLSSVEAHELFDGDNNIATVIRIANEICERRNRPSIL